MPDATSRTLCAPGRAPSMTACRPPRCGQALAAGSEASSDLRGEEAEFGSCRKVPSWRQGAFPRSDPTHLICPSQTRSDDPCGIVKDVTGSGAGGDQDKQPQDGRDGGRMGVHCRPCPEEPCRREPGHPRALPKRREDERIDRREPDGPVRRQQHGRAFHDRVAEAARPAIRTDDRSARPRWDEAAVGAG